VIHRGLLRELNFTELQVGGNRVWPTGRLRETIPPPP